MLSDYFDIDSILSLVKKADLLSGLDEKMVGGLNGLLNILFSMGKSIVEASNFLVEKIYNVDILNKSIDSAFNSGNAVWDNLFKTFGTFFVMMVFIYGIKDFFRHGMERLFVRLLVLASLIVVGTGFYSSGSDFLKKINMVSSNAQTELVSVMAPNVSKPAEQLVSDLGLTEPDTVTGQVQNMMYYRFVLAPSLLMNFGKTDVSTKTINEYTAKRGEYTEDIEDDIKDKVKKASKKNSYLTGKKLGQKWAILINSGIDFVIVAGVILVISVANYLTQLFILMMVLLSPIFLARALLPDNEQVLFNAGKLILGAFAVKVVLGIGFGFVFMVLGWLDSAFGTTTFLGVIASLFVKIILVVLIKKNWRWFVSVLNRQRVDRLSATGFSRSKFKKDVTPSVDSIPQEVKAPIQIEGQGRSDYADNIILQSALDEVQPTRSENFAQKLGYMSERGLGNTLKDSLSNKYQDSKLSSAVDKVTGFDPKEQLSNLANAYHAGKFDAFEKHGFLDNDFDVPVDPLYYDDIDRMTRFEAEGDNKNRTVLSEEEKKKNRRYWNGEVESFEERLAKLRGELFNYDVSFDGFELEPEEWTQTYSFFDSSVDQPEKQVNDQEENGKFGVRYSTEEMLNNDKEIQAEIQPEKESRKETETL